MSGARNPVLLEVLVSIGLSGCAAAPQTPRFAFEVQDIERVELLVASQATDRVPSDDRVIGSLLEVLASAQAHPDHKCESIGTLTFHLKRGTRENITFLPGHDRDSYEFRYRDELFRVSRDRLAAAMQPLGLGRIPE